jgi:hypothetical protein
MGKIMTGSWPQKVIAFSPSKYDKTSRKMADIKHSNTKTILG